MSLPNSGLYSIVNVDNLDKPLERVALYLEHQIKLIQLRCKKPFERNLPQLATEAVKLAEQHSCTLIVNDYLDIAARSGAHGVHLGQEDQSPRIARQILGSEAIIGLSTHTIEQVEAAQSEPVDYLGFGPVFQSPTKSGHAEVTGTEKLQEACKLSHFPIVAIGGINSKNVKEVYQAGAQSAAVISSLENCEDLAAEIKCFNKA